VQSLSPLGRIEVARHHEHGRRVDFELPVGIAACGEDEHRATPRGAELVLWELHMAARDKGEQHLTSFAAFEAALHELEHAAQGKRAEGRSPPPAGYGATVAAGRSRPVTKYAPMNAIASNRCRTSSAPFIGMKLASSPPPTKSP
jgi:hypothetical protein